jgi:hypothetical protein
MTLKLISSHARVTVSVALAVAGTAKLATRGSKTTDHAHCRRSFRDGIVAIGSGGEGSTIPRYDGQ